MLNGARSLADDACLYSEDLVYRRVNESLASNPGTQQTVSGSLFRHGWSQLAGAGQGMM